MNKAISFLVIFAITSSSLWANPGPNRGQIEVIRKKVAQCVDHQRRVVVETYDSRRLQGVISEARTDDFVLIYAGRVTTLSYADIRKIKWQSPVWKHAKAVAAAAGITAAIFGLVVLLGGLKG